MFLTRLAVQRPVTTLMVGLAVSVLGLVALNGLAVDLMPRINFPTISVETYYRGAAPAEVETLITRPLEQALGSVQGTEEVTSVSAEGVSTVRVRMTWGSNLDLAVANMRQAVQKIRQQLPVDVEGPFYRRYDESDSPIIYLALSTRLEPIETTRLAETVIVPAFEQLDGVARVRLRGETRREIQVDLDRDKLEALNLGVKEVVAAISRQNINRPAGDFEEGNLRRLIRSHGEFRDLEEIGGTIVREHDGAIVRVRDVATVIDGEEERTERSRVDGHEGLLVYVHKQSDANTVEVSSSVRRKVRELNARLSDVQMKVRIDKSDFIWQSLANVRRAALYGMGLAAVVLVVFLRNVRSAIVIGITMPFSMLATFVLIYFQGFTLNLISFGGLALGIGLLVDNSIVVLESIVRRCEEGQDARTAAIDGTNEVATAIVASTLTTLIVFLPLVFIGGMTGLLLHQLAWVVCFALVCSLLASLTLTPMLAAHWLHRSGVPRGIGRAGGGRLRRAVTAVEAAYAGVLRQAVDRPFMVLSVLALMLSACVGLWPRIGSEFLPKADEGDLRVRAFMAPGIRLETLNDQAIKIERMVLESISEAERTTVAGFIGGERDDSEDWNECWFRVQLVPRGQRDRSVSEVRADLATRFGEIAGMRVRVEARTEMILSRMIRWGRGDIEVEVQGHDLDRGEAIAEDVADLMADVPGLINVTVERPDRRPELEVRIDRDKAGLLGVSVGDIAEMLETTVRGKEATLYRDAGDEYSVLVRLQDRDRDRIADIGRVGVTTDSGRTVSLGDLVQLAPGNSPLMINRSSRRRVIEISADVEGRDLGSVVADLEKRLARFNWPADFSFRIGGDWEEQQRSFNDLGRGLLLAMVLMYMVMASQFESFRDPLVILVTIPLGAIGVILVLVLTDTTLNAQSLIGLVMLSGIVVNNAIVLIDCINQQLASAPDDPLAEVIVRAAVRRFRPIVMTTLTTVLAMLPIALGWGEGGELQSPMARVVIGGLLSGSLITLLAIPVVYRLTRRREPGEPGMA